jgi:glutamate carboxypeptidase
VADKSVLEELRQLQDSMLLVLEDLVMVETPSEDRDCVRDGVRLLSGIVHRLLGEVPETVEVDGRPHVRLRGSCKEPVLLLCHLDTVWPAGTTARWPFTVSDGLATGPGVFDMKAGLVQAIYAVSVLQAQDDVTLLVTTDEEIGSASGRSLVEAEARRARAVLVCEPSAAGALKVARKGTSMYELHVQGRAAHAGLEPERGINALVELAHQLPIVVSLLDASAGTTVTPTMAKAGSTANTVPATAQLSIDVRATTLAEQQRVDAALRSLRPVLDGATLRLAGDINRPPLERSASAALLDLVQLCSASLGLEAPSAAAVGGGSDGNFTAAIGVPTLDGLGAVGKGAHAEGEHVVVSTMPERAALLAALVDELRETRS